MAGNAATASRVLRVAELCAGYSGLFLAMRAAGWPVELAWYAETDPAACTVLAAHHPGVPNARDITTAQFSAQEPVDIVAAGWPCQPVSGAGQQRGSDDERWLWPDVARAVRMLQPAVFVGENVPRLLTIEQGALFGGVLADLDQAGYTIRWTTVGACKVGLCHHRHRVFLAATRMSAKPARHPLARRAGNGWETAADTLFGDGAPPEWPAAGIVSGGLAWELPAEPCGITSGIALLPTPTAVSYRWNRSPYPGAPARPSLEGVVQMLPTPNATDAQGGPRAVPESRTHDGKDHGPRLRDVAAALLPTPKASDTGTPGRRAGDGYRPPLSQVLLPTPTAADGDRVSPTYYRGNPTLLGALLPTPTARDGDSGPGYAASAEGTQDLRTVAAKLLPTPTAVHHARGATARRRAPLATTNTDGWTLHDIAYTDRWGEYGPAVRRHELVTGMPAPEPTEPGTKGRRRLAPALPEWMHGLPRGWVTDHVGRSPALRLVGNGIAIPAGAYALSLLLPAALRHELTEVAYGT